MGVDDVRVVEWLRQQGHDAIHVRDLGMQRAPDSSILARALAEARAVLTFDPDFGELVVLARHLSPRECTRYPCDRASRRLLTRSADVFIRPAIVLVGEGRHRIRYLPIGQSET